MPKRTVLLDKTVAILLLGLTTLVTIVRALPTPQENTSDPLPLIQFTKGGIRVNFGGYHAEAGLGGLLTGNAADGGLRASAGTAGGAHASAGLGGSLNGGPAGGLHARAGLGNGGPEAEAGLGGTLAESQPQGQLYARSSPGAFAVPDSINRIDRPIRKRSKHIQVITGLNAAAPAVNNGDSNVDAKESPPSPSSTSSSSVSSSSSSSTSGTTVKASGDAANNDAEKNRYPAREYFLQRARERAGPYANKTSPIVINLLPQLISTAPVFKQQEDVNEQPPQQTQRPAGGPINRFRQGIFARATVGADANADANTNVSGTVTGTKYKSSTFFDDIFNIPISALNAVNQLLRNHVG